MPHSRHLLLVLAMLPSLTAAQPSRWEPGWTRFAEPTVIRNADRVHRIAIRDATPVDLLYVAVDGSGIAFESAEVRRADGTSQTIEIRRLLGTAGREGVYLSLCGSPSPIRRLLLRHAPGNPRYNTRVALMGRTRAPSDHALTLPCEPPPESTVPSVPTGYAWGATQADVRARCTTDGGTPTSPEGTYLVCAPFAPLDAVEARFYFDAREPGLSRIEVVRSIHATGESLRDALRDELRRQLPNLGRPRSDPFPVSCDVVFYDVHAMCFDPRRPYHVTYAWGDVPFAVQTEWMTTRDAHELRFVYRRP